MATLISYSNNCILYMLQVDYLERIQSSLSLSSHKAIIRGLEMSFRGTIIFDVMLVSFRSVSPDTHSIVHKNLLIIANCTAL